MKLFHCSQCGQRVFFENTRCESCGAALGYVPSENAMLAFAVDEDGHWRRLRTNGTEQRPCSNYSLEAVCNWMVAIDDPLPLCVACRTTRIIPALTRPGARWSWAELERAKRRLFYTLIGLKLPAPNVEADPVNGLSFQFLEQAGPNERVLTGHEDGTITLNTAEADYVERERIRGRLNEPYRSLVGHFRHESGHYYWDRLIRNTAHIDEYRRLFGDERADYDLALKQHYEAPKADWPVEFISAYASSHPWEDWAECWAHYLHMVDGLETAAAWGLRLDRAVPNEPSLAVAPVPMDAASVEASIVHQWLPVSQFCNAMTRSLGLDDWYPFVVPAPVIAKLDFIHRVIMAAARGEMPMNFSSPAVIQPVLCESAAAEIDSTQAAGATDDASDATVAGLGEWERARLEPARGGVRQ